MKSPAFQFYAGDFLVGVTGMTNEDVGVYIKLLALQWERGALPSAQKTLRAMAGARCKISTEVLSKFDTCEDGMLRNARLEKERAKQADYRDARAKAGALGGKKKAEHAKAENPSTATVLLGENGKQNVALQSPSSSSEVPPIPPATIEQARAAASNNSISVHEADLWWHTRNGVGWLRPTAAGGQMRISSGWQSDMKTFVEAVRETARRNGSGPPAVPKVPQPDPDGWREWINANKALTYRPFAEAPPNWREKFDTR